ncbi:pyridoxamine 5'-phosphate oxidase [Bowmanella dokdonensis]|uniref:Pyridoxine/pyridoxamine 5'-phosphate oxidase n=1 Tax=Bowmanella dokdonensis TaxID=751969 RepID=A0A939DRI0_9ALTE|nr:pyridoxamine 5'-phosphate oxidase [Bowmanella dokdonensis]MBN7827482.1 pyridoxamine 5'-phosphate oxidase [Bowmanella dokdonensis]
MLEKLADIRREYSRGGLDRDDLNPDPILQFESWLKDIIAVGIPDPTAMTVATVDPQGQPSQRIVLLKDVSEAGFVFYTNLGSRKAQELKTNGKISLHFPWHLIERQVKVCGTVEPLSKLQVSKYFLTRPRESQLAAWASQQSRPISTRQMLMSQFHQAREKFAKGEIPLPDFWGGYRVIPHEIEFWQGGEHRLHDRFVYRRQSGQDWQIERLMP